MTETRDGPPPETREQIMEATQRALAERGYADLTMQSIADEFEKSKSLIHYHYDTKEELLTAFLAYLLDEFVARVERADVESPDEKLVAAIDTMLADPTDREGLQAAMLELRAAAPYREAYRRRFAENDAHIRSLLAGIVAEGIETGVYNDVDPDEVAETLLVMVDGARMRRVVLDDPEALEHTRRSIDGYLDSKVRRGE